jgi:hypothetical protein
MVSFIGMGETPLETEDPRACKTVRAEGEEASHEELPRTRREQNSEVRKNHESGRFERVTGLSLPHVKLQSS